MRRIIRLMICNLEQQCSLSRFGGTTCMEPSAHCSLIIRAYFTQEDCNETTSWLEMSVITIVRFVITQKGNVVADALIRKERDQP
ncbi:hypothetical protein Tco_0622262 [Tanacetum coccineum]